MKSVKILKISSQFISFPLNHICSNMLSSGIFPTRLKCAEIKPWFKKGDNNLYNYRPISLVTSFLKVMDKVVYAR
jgi:hypothetical protein